MSDARRPAPFLEVVAALIVRNGRVLVAKRSAGKSNPGLWEFPGGKVEAGETHATALAREIKEELGVDVEVGSHLASNEHVYPFATVRLHAYFCEVKLAGENSPFTVQPEPHALEHAEIRYVSPAEWNSLEFAPANTPLAEALRAKLHPELSRKANET
ncbi:MAG: (deoxy)nucleoside triphosphate pyrophosphohydrolase [Silvanigrellales bacterium]|nr:(deoxy)nucleoside triphosphate pyrophosphohydrolase [Silvanigrellales bacterium]